MKIPLCLIFSILVLAPALRGQTGYEIGDRAKSFTLKNVDGRMASLDDYAGEHGVIVIFMCNSCPFVKAYQERIIALDKKYDPMGYPVIGINSNDPARSPEDSYANMQERAKKMDYPFPYLYDENQEVAREFGALKTPHVYLLTPYNGNWIVRYIGAIDDSPMAPEHVEKKYLGNAIEALENGANPDPAVTKAIGCTIKWKYPSKE